MYIYILIKFIFEFISFYFNKLWLRYFYIFFEIFIIIYYFYFLYKNLIDVNFYLFLWCLFWITFIIFFKTLKLIFDKFNQIINWLEKKEKIKIWLLKSSISKRIYYLVWMLPWNIGYWMYFWVMENGWYFRVWFCSNRDIFFMRYFGWDSRDFFFNLNKILFENFICKKIFYIKDEIIRFFLRVLLVLFFFRKNLCNIHIVEFLLNRIFVFCYLSFFYLSFFDYIQLINKWIIIIIIIIELLFLFFLGFILEYLLTYYKSVIEYFLKYIDMGIFQLFIDPLTYKYYLPTKMFFEVNNMVWNVVLGNSLTLGILKEYMLWVNKNTKGYYYKKMNILPKKNISKLFELSSIPFDILPRTCYVIMQLRYVNNNFYKSIIFKSSDNFNKLILPDYSIRSMKNLYLSYFEKTYAVDSSLLNIIFLLRTNFELNNFLLFDFYKIFNDQPCGKIIRYFILQQKALFWRYRLAEISKCNPELLNVFYVLNNFFLEKRFYDLETYFISNFFLEDYRKKIKNITYNGSMVDYKKNIKLLSHFVLYEEEGIVWNNDILSLLSLFEKDISVNKLKYYEILNNLYKFCNKPGLSLDIEYDQTNFIEDQLFNVFGFKFNQKLDLTKLSTLDLLQIKELDLYLVELNECTLIFFSLLEHCMLVIDALELIDLENVENSDYFFLFEDEKK